MMISPIGCFPLMQDTPFLLLPPNLFDLTDLFLNMAGYLFNGTFRFQLWIVAYFPGNLLTLPFTS
jgi:hypothetical protein